MIAKIQLTYEGQNRLGKIAEEGPDELFERMLAIFPDAKSKPRTELIEHTWYWGTSSEIYVDLEVEGEELLAAGITFEVKRLRGTTIRSMIGPAPESRAGNTYVQVPHIGLLAIKEVKVETDYCTDSLQRDLDQGWMLLCVCPPNAARRPDYILGRTTREK